MTVETPENVSKNEPVVDAPKETPINTERPKVSPAQDLRDIQGLLVNGIFPGQVAPAVVKAYQLLEKMAQQIETQVAAKPEETK
jgi:hypothetical protein